MKRILSYSLFELKKYNKIQVNSIEELESLLMKYNIPLEKWGTQGFKTVDHLFGELQEHECILSDVNGELHRNVDFVGAKIIYKKDGVNYRLCEDRAVFKDGRIRIRPIEHSMAEKLHDGESHSDGLIRGLKEELGMEIDKSQIAFYNKEKFEDNTDYPGIHSFHNGYSYMVTINDSQFKKEYIEHQSDKDIYFKWRKMEKKLAGYYPIPLGGDTAFEKRKPNI